MKKFILFLVGLIIGFIIFIPKTNLFFSGQKYLSNYNIFINFKHLNSSLFTLNLDKVKIYYHGIDGINIDSIKFLPLLFINKITLQDVNILNNKANINLNYNIFTPFKINIDGLSNFGIIKGDINLKTKHLKVYILNLKNNKLKSFLKKDKQGYFYEQSF